MGPPDVVVVGQIARDLVLLVDEVPAAGTATAVRQRREMLGGKGANQAVALAQLGVRSGVLGVVGDDRTGAEILDQARADGVDTTAVVHRAAATGLIVDVVDATGRWRYLEHLPPEVLLSPSDVHSAAPTLTAARTVVLQLQQPPEALVTAAGYVQRAGGRVVLDGALPEGPDRNALLAAAHALRADTHEAELLTGTRIGNGEDAVRAGRDLLDHGLELVVLGAGDAGNAVVWKGGAAVVPLLDVPVVDSTGAGDAFIAGLVAELLRGSGAQEAAQAATAAAAKSVGELGGRPHLASVGGAGGAGTGSGLP